MQRAVAPRVRGPQDLYKRPVLVTGASGRLGQAFARACAERGLAYRLTAHDELDIADALAVEAAIDRHEPWLVVNAAGYGRVDEAEDDVARCHRDNAVGAETLARACARHRLGYLTFSTDLVFDGKKGAPYDETDAPRPLSVFGRSKAIAEARVLDAMPDALVVRTGALFGPWDQRHFVAWTERTLAAGRAVAAASDVVTSVAYVPDLVDECLELALTGARGLRHLASAGTATWYDVASAVARGAGVDPSRVVPVAAGSLGWRAPRPSFSALGATQGALLPSLADALARYQNRPAATAAAPPAVGTTAMTGRSAR